MNRIGHPMRLPFVKRSQHTLRSPHFALHASFQRSSRSSIRLPLSLRLPFVRGRSKGRTIGANGAALDSSIVHNARPHSSFSFSVNSTSASMPTNGYCFASKRSPTRSRVRRSSRNRSTRSFEKFPSAAANN